MVIGKKHILCKRSFEIKRRRVGEIAISSIFTLLIKYAVEFILFRSRLYNARYFARPFPKSELSFISEALRVNIVM
ncbi:Uncharacterised protein [Bartonella quintana]|nr:hypothetical protein O7Q_00121 [Bartonella quintana JK 39]SQF96525.1 Uncharacterised protein [Bartonella quintana]